MLRIDSDKHWVRDTELTRFLRRELNEPTMLTFWNSEAQRWALGYWIDKSKGLVDVLKEVGEKLEDGPQIDKEYVETLKRQHRAPDYKKVRQRIVEGQRKSFRYLQEQQEEMRDQRSWLKKRTGHSGAYFQA